MKDYIIVYIYKFKRDAILIEGAKSYTDAYVTGSLKLPEGAMITAVYEVVGNAIPSGAVTLQKG